MSDSIPSLWPNEFKIDVQTPYTILRVQAAQLGRVTRGILEGAVETETSKEKIQHRLVIIAPAYNGYRHTLIVALHNPDLPYPAEVRAEALAEKVRRENTFSTAIGPIYDTVYPSAHNDDQMQALVRSALHSEKTMAAVLSLIAKSNEAKLSSQKSPQTSEEVPDKADQESRLPEAETGPEPEK
jgi:hypothetical protein